MIEHSLWKQVKKINQLTFKQLVNFLSAKYMCGQISLLKKYIFEAKKDSIHLFQNV